MKLEEIAQVKIGVLAKRENDINGENCYELFSLKNYEEEKQYEILKTNKDLKDKIAQEGDLLFRLLAPTKIVFADRNIKGKLIPSQFCIIRTKKNIMDPIVLKWYLESENAKVFMNEITKGSIIKSTSVAELKKIEIPNISIDKQENMKQLISLWKKEKKCLERILNKKEILYNCYLEEMLEEGEV